MDEKIINLGNKITNCYIYHTGKTYVLIDTGLEKNFHEFYKNLNDAGIKISDIGYIFLTHAHNDHAGLLKNILDSNLNIKLICSNKAKDVLYKGQNPSNCGLTNKLMHSISKLVKKQHERFPALCERHLNSCLTVEENKEEIERILGGKVVSTSGHTSDSISLLLKDKILFCGDVAMNFILAKNFISLVAEDKKDYINSWKKIINLKPSIIYPGHGKPFGYKELEKNLKHLEKMEIYY